MLWKNCFLLIKITLIDQLKIIENKAQTNQAQNDLERLEAKLSAYSSCGLRKYEYLTGDDLGCKLTVFGEARFNYSQLDNVFNNGFDKDDQEEGLFKRLENIKGKNEKLLTAFSAANKVSKTAKNKNDFNYGSNYAFY